MLYYWLLEESVRQAIDQAFKSGLAPTALQQQEFEASYYAEDGGPGSRILSIAGDQAETAIHGVLTDSPNLMARLFGGGNTTYAEIQAALTTAENNDAVKGHTLDIKSPGGSIMGLFNLLAFMDTLKKPVTARVNGLAASAAYAIAAKADKIVATNKADRFGSIGVMAKFYTYEDEVVLRSDQAPLKNPDPKTEEVSAMHELFAEEIATGRNTTVENVNAEFGRGGTFLAEEALKRGMIDEISGGTSAVSVGSSSKPVTAQRGAEQEDMSMDLGTLKAQHPDVYSAAVQVGTDQAYDSVNAHLILGKSSGDMIQRLMLSKTAKGCLLQFRRSIWRRV